MKKEKKNQDKQGKNHPLHEYARYTGLGFQILAYMLAGIGIGQFLDGYVGNETPFFTIALAFVAIIGIIDTVIKEMT